MKAVVCTKYGPPEVLQIQEVKKPVPKENEVLIKVMASTVSAADYRVRSFKVPLALWLPARLIMGIGRPKRPILGAELSGIIAQVGNKVTRFKPGDEIFAATLPVFGGYAEYACLPEGTSIALKPNTTSWEEAALLPIGAKTALFYLNKANLEKGQKILIYGASGSVGTYAIQLAKHFGAEVTAVCSESNFDLATSLGADHVIDYTKKNWDDALSKYNVFFVAVDKCPFSIAAKTLYANGTYINISNPIKSPSMMRKSLFHKMRILMANDFPESFDDLCYIKHLVETKILRPVRDKTYLLDEIIEAHQYVDKGHKKGNVAIKII
ncbi:MAG: NAD(P)-dependent alcohol dehydrogenase [Saonia sp.]